MCKTKFLQLCSFSITFTSLHSLNLSFPLLSYFTSTAIPNFPPLFSTSLPWFPAFSAFPPRFQTKIPNSYFSSKANTPLCYYCITLGTKSLFTSSETPSVISSKKNYLKVPKTYNLFSISNNYEWMKCYLRFMSKKSRTCPKLSIFS